MVGAQRAVLAALIKEPHRISTAPLHSTDFTGELMPRLFTALTEMVMEGIPIDIITVSEHSKIDLSFIGGMVRELASTANFDYYVDIVLENSRLRQSRDIGQKLIDGTITMNDAHGELMRMCTTKYDTSQTISDILPQVIDDIDSDRTSGMPTGFVDMDKVTAGLHRSDLVVIAARPSMGKTALMLNIANNLNVPIGIFSIEQARTQIAQRLICIEGGVSCQRMRHGALHSDEYDKISKASAVLSKKPMVIDDRGNVTVEEIIATARRWKYEKNIDALFIDYLQKIRGDNRISRAYQIEDIVSRLKSLAKELDIPIVALAQVNRRVEERDNKRPLMSDIKDSGSIEQEADMIITLYRDEVYNRQTHDTGIAELCALKNRHGETCGARLAWMGEFLRFRNLTR